MIRSGKMIEKIVQCSFILFLLSGNHCSPTERDLYAFTTIANARQSTTDSKSLLDKVQDTETAETNIYSDPYGGTTEFRSEDIALEDSKTDPPGPADHEIPYSEHENPDEVPTKPKYVAPGTWAKPDPKKNIPLDFIPTKTLAQVRGTHTVKVLPQSEAIAAATSDEERKNAPRLREVVSKKKTNTVYSEEGYEDSAYDHAGHIRDADFHEGYARKLHDERHSKPKSGAAGKKKSKKRKSKRKNSGHRSEDFEEFNDDYSDERSPNEKYEVEGSSKKEKQNNVNKIYKEMWKRPDVNPKIVAENEIEKLEYDLKKEDEEAEKGSENYGSVTETDLRWNTDGEDTNERSSAASSGSSDKISSDSEYSPRTRSDFERNTRYPSPGIKEKYYKENYEATTIQFETPTPRESEQYEASTSSYENPTTNKFYLPEGSAVRENYEATTFTYDGSNNPQPIINDVPTTMNYGDVFWQYFRNKPNEVTSPTSYIQEQTTIHQPLLVQDTTTLGPFEGQSPPVALATINGHGPYLLVSENGEVTQNPNQFGVEGLSYAPTTQNSQNYIDPNGILNHGNSFVTGQGKNSRIEQSFPSFSNTNGPTTSAYGTWGLNNGGYESQDIRVLSTEPPTTSFYDNIAFSSTPAHLAITLPPNNYESLKEKLQQNPSNQKNPISNSIKGTVRNKDSYNRENFNSLYNGWRRNNPNLPARATGHGPTFGPNPNEGKKPLSSKFHRNNGESFFGYKPNLEYSKMLGFIKSNRNNRYNRPQSESSDSEDFTIMKPPALRESMFSDFTLNSYPNVAGYSSVTQESEAAQETNGKKIDASKSSAKYNGLSRKDIHSKSPAFYRDLPSTVIHRKKIFPASKLLPPAPNSKDIYADRNFANQKNEYRKPLEQFHSNYANGVTNYNPDPEQLSRYLKNRRTPARHTRSVDEAVLSEEKIADAVIAQEINARFNFTFEDQESSKYREAELPRNGKLRAKRNLLPEESQSVTEELLPLVKNVFSNEKHTQIYTDRSMRDKRSHQDLLDASHKIASDVVDREIKSRFKTKDHDAANEDYDEGGEEEEEKENDEDDDEDVEAKREKQVEVEPPDLDYLDEIQEINDIENIPTTTVASIDFQKYPFYQNTKVSNSSPLKYIINPKEVPKKTFGGMEFYDSRDKYIHCDEVDPNLDEVIPEDEEPVPNRGPKENLPRLRGLGDKLDCFKAKYFGQNPFDNPLFFEKKITQPTPPPELDPVKFATRISELPKVNKDYFIPAQSRKPETVAIKRMDINHSLTKSENLAKSLNVKSSAEPRTRRRNNSNRAKSIETLTEEPQREIRRSRKRRPAQKPQTTTTELPEINSVTPYQKEVYDDVMGTIKNLASLYEMFGAQAISPITEPTIASTNAGRIQGASSIRNVQTVNRVPSLNGKRGKDLHLSSVTESPFHEEIEGLLPPPELNKKPKLSPYRTNKVSYNTRVRTESPLRNGDKKIIGYFRTVMVHKRSLDGYADTPNDPQTETRKRTKKKRNVMDSETEETQTNLRTVDPNTISSTTERPKRGRRRKTDLTTTTTTTVAPAKSDAKTQNNDGTPKPRYTIRNRLRNSKDDRSTSRYELFTTTQRASASTDGRRNEPRYSEIIRTRSKTATTTTTASPQEFLESNSTTLTVIPDVNGSFVKRVTESEDIYATESTAPRRTKVSVKDIEPSGEIYRAIASEFEPEHAEEDDEDRENYEEEEDEDEEEEEESTDKPVKKIKNYDVHEDVQEDTTPSVVGFPMPTKSSAHVDLETFLRTDPPGYGKAFPEESEKTTSSSIVDRPKDEKENYRNEESKEEPDEESDEEHRVIPQNASYREGESSDEDGTESPKTLYAYKDFSNDNADKSENEGQNSEQKDGDDKTFFRYNARPDSPFESFEDEKYSSLGSRVNKPAFHHPPFKAPKYERHYIDDSEETEKDKTDESLENGKYVFPWIHDEEDEKAEAQEYTEQTTEKYEYPWEKRERLAAERRERRKERERLKKLRDFSFLHDDHDDDDEFEDEDDKKGSSSENNGKRAYPWDVYDVPSKAYKKNFRSSDELDNDETSSEHRPVAKFSSKYSSSKFRLPFSGSEPITVAEPKKIRASIVKFLKEADEKSVEPTVAYETEVLTTSKPGLLNKTPVLEEKKESKNEPVSSGSKNNKRITNSRIIPENITSAPRKRSRSKITPVRDRTTLRPVIRSTTEAALVAKVQTMAAPITTTRRPSRSRARLDSAKQRPSYKAQESQITSSAVLPAPKLTTTTTEIPVKSSTENPRRLLVRKRGKPNGISTTLKTNTETSSERQKDVTERSTQATTTIRRRARPAVATNAATTKTIHKNHEKPKTPSRVDKKSSVMKTTTYDGYRIPTMSSVHFEDRNVEDSTPTSRTVEHRSRISKEEIITKTSFPDPDTMYKMYKDKSTVKKTSPLNANSDDGSMTNYKPKKNHAKTPGDGKNSFGETESEYEKPVKNESMEKLSITTKETPEHVYEKKEIFDEDGQKGMFITITPKNRTIASSTLEDEVHMREMKMEEPEKRKEQRYDNLNETESLNTESIGDIEISAAPEDRMVLDHVLRKIPPRSNQLKETEESSEEYVGSEDNSSAQHEDHYNGYEGSNESEEDENSEEIESMLNFEKDPSRRLYYYLNHKK